MFLLNHVLTRGRHILHHIGRKQHWGLCKKEQLQLLRKQSMPMCHNSTSTSAFFKNINLKLKWKTSHFRCAPKTLERQLLNQNIAHPFFFHFFSFTHLFLWASLNDNNVGLHLSFNSTCDHLILILQKVRTLHFFAWCCEFKCNKSRLFWTQRWWFVTESYKQNGHILI